MLNLVERSSKQYFYPNNAELGNMKLRLQIQIYAQIHVLLYCCQPLPEITCPNIFQMCANSGSIELNISEPIGGTYLGNGITNNILILPILLSEHIP